MEYFFICQVGMFHLAFKNLIYGQNYPNTWRENTGIFGSLSLSQYISLVKL